MKVTLKENIWKRAKEFMPGTLLINDMDGRVYVRTNDGIFCIELSLYIALQDSENLYRHIQPGTEITITV